MIELFWILALGFRVANRLLNLLAIECAHQLNEQHSSMQDSHKTLVSNNESKYDSKWITAKRGVKPKHQQTKTCAQNNQN